MVALQLLVIQLFEGNHGNLWLTLGGPGHFCFSAVFVELRVCLETRSMCVFVRVYLCEFVCWCVCVSVCVCKCVCVCAYASSLEISNRLQILSSDGSVLL